MNSHLGCLTPWRFFWVVQKWTMSPCHVLVTPYVLVRGLEEDHCDDLWKEPAFPLQDYLAQQISHLMPSPHVMTFPRAMPSSRCLLPRAPGRGSSIKGRSTLRWLLWPLVCNFHLGLQRITALEFIYLKLKSKPELDNYSLQTNFSMWYTSCKLLVGEIINTGCICIQGVHM